MSTPTPTLWWVRHDLRTDDNPALTWAAARGPVVPVVVVRDLTLRPLGGASQWWLHHSLAAFQQQVPLHLTTGLAADELPRLAKAAGATAVVWARGYAPDEIRQSKAVKEALERAGIAAHSVPGNCLREPWDITNNEGAPMKVFTPFWKRVLAHGWEAPQPAPTVQWQTLSGGKDLAHFRLLPTKPNWANGWEKFWQPGEAGTQARAEEFLTVGLKGYGELRNRPDLPHVSRLSPAIHFGEISVRRLAQLANARAAANPGLRADADKFLSELGWREFAHHLLYHYPTLPTQNWKTGFDNYPWRDPATDPVAAADLTAWQRGQTGYPFVDAGMRELWQTGWLHNRVRMVVASFLIKHLRIHWQHGEAWFWETLCDADAANNAASWQWVAGSGADAAPYFRIFNPIGQGEKFDPEGAYTRQYCPELAALPNEFLQQPWAAPALVLKAADVTLGQTYPHPIVNHEAARAAALAGYERVKGS
ncbi:MAG: deoxyribodipyrimidine photo-lyase [Alphaproteobacteria bacterium]|nr:deoxyribodipyrimidine photo-lyase [Alphaproteobacteria bacterium]